MKSLSLMRLAAPLFAFLIFHFSWRAAQSATASRFALALPGYKFAFPRDHGAHSGFATEWWYFTGHLKARDGRRFGYQATWFRVALAPQTTKRASNFATRDVLFGHLALTDERGRKFYFTDRISRAALSLAGADVAGAKSPRVWLGPWSLRFLGDGRSQKFSASGTSEDGTPFGLALQTRALTPPTVQGERGVSQKAQGLGRASHYYSFCRLQTSGIVNVNGERLAVSGQSWFDHEFGSNQLGKDQVGWDWFSLQLNDGRALMLYRMRRKNGSNDPYSSGTLVEPNGRARHLKLRDFQIETLQRWKSPHSGATYPSKWRLSLPRENLVLTVTPILSDQELRTNRSSGVTYWEGACDVQGAQGSHAVRGRAYVELTGYSRAFAGTF